MGIRFYCPRGHKLNVKAELAGKIGICPECGEKMLIPFESTRESSHKHHAEASESPESGREVSPESEETVNVTIHQPQTEADRTVAHATASFPSQDVSETRLPAGMPQYSAEMAEMAKTEAYLDPEGDGNMVLPDTDKMKRVSDGDSETSPDVPIPKLPIKPSDIESNSLLADPNLVWYARTADNQSYGPATNIVMKSWIKEKRIGPSILIWREGWSSWLVARNVFPELEAIFAESPPVQTNSKPVAPPAASDSSAGEPKGLPAVSLAPDLSPVSVGAEEPPTDVLPHIVMDAEPIRAREKARKKKKKEVRDFVMVIGLIAIIAILIVILFVILIRQQPKNPSVPSTPAPAATASEAGEETTPKPNETPAEKPAS